MRHKGRDISRHVPSLADKIVSHILIRRCRNPTGLRRSLCVAGRAVAGSRGRPPHDQIDIAAGQHLVGNRRIVIARQVLARQRRQPQLDAQGRSGGLGAGQFFGPFALGRSSSSTPRKVTARALCTAGVMEMSELQQQLDS